MRSSNCFQTENVRARAAKDKINRDVAAEVFLKQFGRARSYRIVAISEGKLGTAFVDIKAAALTP